MHPDRKPHPGILILVVIALLFLAAVPAVSLGETGTGVLVRLQYASFDPLAETPDIPAVLQSDSPVEAVWLVQFTGPAEDAWLQAVEAAGARLYSYIPDYTYLARLDAAALQALQAMPFVRWAGPYHPAYRLAPTLHNAAASPAPDPVQITAITLPGADLPFLADRATALGGQVLRTESGDLAGYLSLTLPAGRLPALAALDGVVWVEPAYEKVLLNDISSGTIMKAGSVRASLGLYGKDQVVGIADTGLDVGTTGPEMSDDFEGRIAYGGSVCAQFGLRTTWNDFNGHGTHTSGSILGSGVLSGALPASSQYDRSFSGVAPQARLVFQAIDDSPDIYGALECIDSILLKSTIFTPAYLQGARIHSNSWGGLTGGSNGYGGYDVSSQSADDAAYAYPNMLILFAAGNAGTDDNRNGIVDPDSLTSPGTAKNVLTVGASETVRTTRTETWGSWWPSDFPTDPIRTDLQANRAEGMAAFSSRGPADDGRIKPDVVAPGTWIISARSHDPSAGYGWEPYDANYVYQGGTSMATPLTAGAAAIVREWLVKLRSIANPSSALMKAVLLNGAASMGEGQYGTGATREIPAQWPNPVNGWGRVDLQESLNPPAPRQVWLQENTSGVRTASQVTYKLRVGGASTSGSPPDPLEAGTSTGQALPPSPGEPLLGQLVLGAGPLVGGPGGSAASADGSTGLGSLADSTSTPTPTPTPKPTATPTPTATPVPSYGGPLRITLAWTDYPGSPAAAKALVNDLDLEVIGPDNTHYYGNTGVYSGGACLRTSKWDACNNVESVQVPKGLYGTYTIIIHGYNVPSGPQPFALVASGDCLLGGSCLGYKHAIFLPNVIHQP